MKRPAVYIMTNRKNGTIYIGVTSSLLHRIYQHKNGLIKGFTSRYGCNILVYYELHATMKDAISREKELKGHLRKKKIELIENMNPEWEDLYSHVVPFICA